MTQEWFFKTAIDKHVLPAETEDSDADDERWHRQSNDSDNANSRH